MPKNPTGAQQMRFAMIESLLRWERQISNRRLRQLMGLSPVQASRLIAAYRRRYPDSLKEDTREKRFVLVQDVPLSFAFGTLHEYGHYMLAQGEGSGFEDLNIELAAIAPSHFAMLREACDKDAWVEIVYAARAAPEPGHFSLRPQRMIRSGSGWYVRAWAQDSESFETFNLARIQTTKWGAVHLERAGLPKDERWLKKVELRLQAHSALSLADERAVRRECFKGAVARRVPVRECLVALVLRDLRIAVEPRRQSPPEFTLELANEAEVRQRVANLAEVHL